MAGGRLAGYIIPGVVMTALSYGLGKMSGQDDQTALISALGGVGGAIGGEIAMRRAFPNASLNLNVRNKKVPIHYGGTLGALAGGYVGSGLADAANHAFNSNQQESTAINPLLLAADDLAVPAISIAKAFI